MIPEDIKDKAGAVEYLRLCNEKMGHYPLAIGVPADVYRTIIREMHEDPRNDRLRAFLNGVMIVNIEG